MAALHICAEVNGCLSAARKSAAARAKRSMNNVPLAISLPSSLSRRHRNSADDSALLVCDRAIARYGTDYSTYDDCSAVCLHMLNGSFDVNGASEVFHHP